MSRFTITKVGRDENVYRVSYGIDHAVGAFMQVFAPVTEEPLYDKDNMFDKITLVEMNTEVYKTFGIDMVNEIVRL